MPADLPSLPPFAYSAGSAAFEKRWMDEIPRRIHALQTRFIPERNILKYSHGGNWTLGDTEGKEVPGEFERHEEIFSLEMAAQQNGELERLTQLADEMALRFAGGMERQMLEKVDEVAKETGNVVTWNKSAKNAPEMFLEILEKIEFGVTPDGKPSLPSFVNFDPAFLAELAAYSDANERYREEVEAIKARKVAEALAREAERKAKFQRRQ